MQPLKVSSSIRVTGLGMLRLVSDVHWQNAPGPMRATDLGIFTLVNLEQLVNANSEIERSALGIVKLATELAPAKA